MYVNHWLERSAEMIEQETLLVQQSPQTHSWFTKMFAVIPALFSNTKPQSKNEFTGKIGLAHHLKLTKYGIEGVLKLPRKYHRLQYYVLYDKVNIPNDPFWIVVHK